MIPKWYPLITLRSLKRYNTQTRIFFATGVVKETFGTIRSETLLFYNKKIKTKKREKEKKRRKNGSASRSFLVMITVPQSSPIRHFT